MRAILSGLALALWCVGATAQPPRFRLEPIARPAEADAVPLWPEGAIPAGRTPERWGRLIGAVDGNRMDARIVRNVSRPVMIPVLPDPAKATGAAVIVAPGGAFLSLSMDHEGYAVARWLADHGIAAFILKYRLNETPAEDGAFMAMVGRRMAAITTAEQRPAEILEPRATEDALRAIRLVREGAARWQIDPARVGILGFSAGAMTALQAVQTGKGAARPDFVGHLYGPMTAVPVAADAPPLFSAFAMDDPLMGGRGFGLIEAWHKAGRPVELHAYERGGHGFGTGQPGTTTMLVLEEFRLWLAARGMLGTRS